MTDFDEILMKFRQRNKHANERLPNNFSSSYAKRAIPTMPQAEDTHRGTLRIQGINFNGCINRRHLLMNEINSTKGKNTIYVINDIRLQHGEENRLNLTNHNATIHNIPLRTHRAG